MKKKKQMKILLAIVVALAIVFSGWLMIKPGGLKAEEKNTPSINSVGTSGDITEKFKADVNKVLRDTAPEPDPYNPNPSVIDNGDGTKTFIAAYNTSDAQVNVTGLGLLDNSGNPASWTSSNFVYSRGIKFTIKIIRNKGEYSIEPGDKILIPITMSEREKTLASDLSIPNIGEFHWIDGSGYEAIVDQTLPEELTQVSETNFPGGFLMIGYNATSHNFYWKPMTVFFGDNNVWGILQSTQTVFPTVPYRDSVSPGAYGTFNSAGAAFTDAFYFENYNALQSRLKGNDPAPLERDDIIQMQKLTFTSKSKIYKYDGMEKEALNGSAPLALSNETGEVLSNDEKHYKALDFYSSVDLSSVDLSGDFDSQWKAIRDFMGKQDTTNIYGIVKIEETANTTTFIVALKINTQEYGLKLTNTSQYLDYYQETVGNSTPSPADFFYKTYGLEYDEPLKSRVNAAYENAVYYNVLNMQYQFADGTLPYHYELQYVNDLETNSKKWSGNSNPNKILADGQTMVVVEFLDAETKDALKNVGYIIGEPTTEDHPDQAVILPSVLEIPGYVLDKDKLPEEIAEEQPDGSWRLDFPSLDAEDKRTYVPFYYKALPTINLTKTGADNDEALRGVKMSIGAKVTTSSGDKKLMSLPALYQEMTGEELKITADPLVTDADGKIAMPSTDPRIETMWDLQSQGSGGTVQRIDQWVFVETQAAADKYQPSPFKTFDTTGGQSDIPDPDSYQNQFVFDITPALEIGEGKSYSVDATNKLNQFKVQPTAIDSVNNKPLTDINYTIAGEIVNSGTDSDNLALGVGSATEYTIEQNNTLPGYTLANTTQSFTIVQNPDEVNKFTVTKLPETNDAFDFYYTDDEGKEQLITPGTPFTSSNFLTNPILYVKVKNKPGENLLAVTKVINFNEKGDEPHSLPLKDAGPVFPNHDWEIRYTNDDPHIENLALKVKLTQTFKNGNEELNGILRFKSADGTVKEFNKKDDEETLYDKDKLEGLSTTERVIEFAEGSKTGFFLDGAAINAAYQRGEIPPGTSNYQAELTFTLAADPIPTP